MKEKGFYLPDGTFRKVNPLVEKPPIERPKDTSQYLDYFRALQELRRTEDLWKDEVNIKVQTGGLPFFLMPLSDLHLGSSQVEYDKVEQYLRYLKDYPVYTILIGDLADNFSPTAIPSGMNEALAPPTDQFGFIRAFFKDFSQKIISNVSGNHDSRTSNKSGVDIFRWLAEDLQIPLLHAGGTINLTVDDQTYKILCFHQISRFNSSFNPTHSGKRALEFYKDADVVISGHTHRGGIEKLTHRDNRKPMVLSCGTFKTEDSFQKESGRIVPFDIFYPTLIFFANRKNVEMVEDLDSAKEMIDAVYQFYKNVGIASLGFKS
jgi:predicted phosphodiesterase